MKAIYIQWHYKLTSTSSYLSYTWVIFPIQESRVWFIYPQLENIEECNMPKHDKKCYYHLTTG